jgi:hypothetical protein
MRLGHHTFDTCIAHHYFRPDKQIQPIMPEPVLDHAPGATVWDAPDFNNNTRIDPMASVQR